MTFLLGGGALNNLSVGVLLGQSVTLINRLIISNFKRRNEELLIQYVVAFKEVAVPRPNTAE